MQADAGRRRRLETIGRPEMGLEMIGTIEMIFTFRILSTISGNLNIFHEQNT